MPKETKAVTVETTLHTLEALRACVIAAQYEAPPDILDVEIEALIELRNAVYEGRR